MNFAQAIQTPADMVSTRARKAGYAAFNAGKSRQAPVEVGEYAGLLGRRLKPSSA